MSTMSEFRICLRGDDHAKFDCYGDRARQTILINEVAAATGVAVRKINRLIDDAILPKSACVKIGTRRALRAFAVPVVGSAASDGAKLSKNIRLEAMYAIEKFAKENWRLLRKEPEQARSLRFESGYVVVSPGEPVSSALAGLNKLDDALGYITKDP